MGKEISEEEQAKIKAMIDDLMVKAKKASEEYMKLTQEDVDRIIKTMSMAGLEHHMELAKMAVEETGRGIYEDKITKNMFATEYIYHSIRNLYRAFVIQFGFQPQQFEVVQDRFARRHLYLIYT